MPGIYLRQPGFTYNACRLFTKTKKGIQKLKETGDSCFQHNMGYGDFKDLSRRIASDKVWHDKALNITKNPKNDGYQRGLGRF